MRVARVEDAKALAQVAEATSRAAFGAVDTPANMDLHCRSHFAEPIQAAQIAGSSASPQWGIMSSASGKIPGGMSSWPGR